jgi:6-pyruvoyltetrahydropterin/6-carboxytetrahydropterin synthase
MTRWTSVELAKPKQKFSAGHFTMFSPTERENLHGHNFHVVVRFEAEVGEGGLAFDFQQLKDRIEAQCRDWNELVLLPSQSPWLLIDDRSTEPYVYATFNGEAIPFLRRDIRLLPMANGSLEELSRAFLEALADDDILVALHIAHIEVHISTEPGQSAGTKKTVNPPRS